MSSLRDRARYVTSDLCDSSPGEEEDYKKGVEDTPGVEGVCSGSETSHKDSGRRQRPARPRSKHQCGSGRAGDPDLHSAIFLQQYLMAYNVSISRGNNLLSCNVTTKEAGGSIHMQ